MTKQVRISPSILNADFANMGEIVEKLEAWGADLIHCDVMDGTFVPNISFGPQMISDLKKRTSLPLDVHLMVDRPERYIQDFRNAGADWITVHQEATVHLQRTLSLIRASGAKCGVVLNPATSLSTLEYVLDDVDLVLLMSVNPGFGGQKFIPAVLEKARRLREMLGDRDVDIEIDGGVSDKNAQELVDAGVTVLVAGSAVLSAKDPQAMIQSLRCGR